MNFLRIHSINATSLLYTKTSITVWCTTGITRYCFCLLCESILFVTSDLPILPHGWKSASWRAIPSCCIISRNMSTTCWRLWYDIVWLESTTTVRKKVVTFLQTTLWHPWFDKLIIQVTHAIRLIWSDSIMLRRMKILFKDMKEKERLNSLNSPTSIDLEKP